MLTMVILSSMIALSSSSWLMIWIWMEMNMLTMCWMMAKETKMENMKKDSVFIYMMTQMVSSILILCLILVTNHPQTTILCVCLLSMKMGVWPFHMWYMKTISMMEINMKSTMTVMTWQKIMPIMLMTYFPTKILITMMSMVSMLSPISKLKKNSSTKSIMILSSLNNNGWFLLSSIISTSMFTTYFLLYSLSLIISLKFVEKMKNKIYMTMKKFWENMLILGNMMSIPPTPMFLGKIMILMVLMKSTMPKEIMMIMLIMATILSYHYTWAITNSIMLKTQKSQLSLNKPTKSALLICSLSILCLLWILNTLGLTTQGLLW